MRSLRRIVGKTLRRLGLTRTRPAPAGAGTVAARPAATWTFPEGGGSFDQRVEVFRSLLGLFPPGRLVDLACGTGIFSIAAQEMGWDVTAIDARTERMPMTPGIMWLQQDIREADVAGYDVITLLGLLYHLELSDQLDLLRRCSSSVTILDTHHSLRPTHREGGYMGHTFRELPPDREAQLAATPTAAWATRRRSGPRSPSCADARGLRLWERCSRWSRRTWRTARCILLASRRQPRGAEVAPAGT